VSDLSPDLIGRLAKIIAMLSSPNDGDLIAAGRALQRHLTANGADIYALVDLLKASEDRNRFGQEIANAAYAEGLKDGEARARPNDFHSVDESAWREIALYVQREQHRLPSRTLQKSAEFISDMAARAESQFSRDLSPKQHEWLRDLFHKLGGKIT
jgi:hypothetical protein